MLLLVCDIRMAFILVMLEVQEKKILHLAPFAIITCLGLTSCEPVASLTAVSLHSTTYYARALSLLGAAPPKPLLLKVLRFASLFRSV